MYGASFGRCSNTGVSFRVDQSHPPHGAVIIGIESGTPRTVVERSGAGTQTPLLGIKDTSRKASRFAMSVISSSAPESIYSKTDFGTYLRAKPPGIRVVQSLVETALQHQRSHRHHASVLLRGRYPRPSSNERLRNLLAVFPRIRRRRASGSRTKTSAVHRIQRPQKFAIRLLSIPALRDIRRCLKRNPARKIYRYLNQAAATKPRG